MIEVKIPSEIRAYKSKLIAGLSVRQVISLSLAILVGVPLSVFGRRFISADILMWLIIFLSAPILAWGFLTFQDMNFEDYMKAFLSMTFLPQKRTYENTEYNLFVTLRNECLEEKSLSSVSPLVNMKKGVTKIGLHGLFQAQR